MKSYKQWTKAERLESLKKTKAAIANGVIPEATQCNRCKQTEGIIQYHNHDYSDPILYLEALCWRCHMIHHSLYRSPMNCAKYWEEICQGKMYPAVHKHDFAILARDHGIN